MHRSRLLFGRFSSRAGGRECEWISLSKRLDFFQVFDPVGADHQQIGFENCNALGDELDQRSSRVLGDGRIHRILEDVAEFARDLAEQRVAVTAGAAFQSVSRDVQPLNVVRHRIRILENAGVLPQELQVLGGFLKEDLDEFSPGRAHTLYCATARFALALLR
jgi:hypothetical protein